MTEHLGGAVARALGLGTLLLSGCLGGGGGGGGSALGESCQRTRDCEGDLVCLNLTCVVGAASDAAGGAGGGAGGFGGFGGFGGGAGGEGGGGGAGNAGGQGGAGNEGGAGGAGNEGGAGGAGNEGGAGGAGNEGGAGGAGNEGGAGGAGNEGGQGGAGNEGGAGGEGGAGNAGGAGGEGGAGNAGGAGGEGGGVSACGGRDGRCPADQFCDPDTDTCQDGCRFDAACTTRAGDLGVCARPERICAPLRACCLPAEDCTEATEADCLDLGGAPVLDAPTCDEAPRCFEPSVRTFEGIREDVAVADLERAGFERCHQSTYAQSVALATVQGDCDGPVLLVGCAPEGAARLTLGAMGLRDDVFRDVGTGRQASHVHNGAQWYFSGSWSFGFAPVGAEINRFNCDYLGVPVLDDMPRPDGHLRMCWHTEVNQLSVGYRCGLANSSEPPFDGDYVRVIYQRAGRLD